jgi:hypothetical protein
MKTAIFGGFLFPLAVFGLVYWLAGGAWPFNQMAMPLAASVAAITGAAVTYVANRNLADHNQKLNRDLETVKAQLKTKGERGNVVFASQLEATKGLMVCVERINQFLVPMEKGHLNATDWAQVRRDCDGAATRLAEVPHGIAECWAEFATNTNNIVCEVLKGSDGDAHKMAKLFKLQYSDRIAKEWNEPCERMKKQYHAIFQAAEVAA